MIDAPYPFNNDNIGPGVIGQPDYPALITPSYFNDASIIPMTPRGKPIKTAVGWGTQFPIGLFGTSAWDLCMNVKAMFYQVSAVFQQTVGEDIFYHSDIQRLDASGIIRRFFVSSGTIFRNKFQSINKGNINNKTTTDAVLIDFTKAFYDIRSGVGITKKYWWFPQIVFEIAGPVGYITNGYDMSTMMSFMDFKEIIPSIPLQLVPSVPGIEIESIFYAREIYMTERYDEIYFNPTSGPVGTEVTIVCPPAKPQYDNPGKRDGFEDVVEITFSGAPPITNFTKVKNSNGVWDTIKVNVPAGAKSEVIKFKSVANATKPNTTTDYYTTTTEFRVT